MIIRSEFKSNYTKIHNEILNDPDLSAKAKGILVQLLSKPDSWRLNVQYLVNTNKEGHYAIRATIKELEEKNFIHRFVAREKGKITGTEYLICDRVTSRADAEAFWENSLCVDRPAQEQRAHVIDNNTPMQAPDPEPIPQDDQAQVVYHQEVSNHEADIEETCIQVNRIQVNRIQVFNMQETAPIINTDINKNLIKQNLRVTTTTTPAREAEPVPEPVICDQVLSLPSSSSPTKEIINLIPSQHRSPVVLSLVSKAIVDYPEREVKEAIAYAGANVRGGSMQYKAYLDKTLKNKWADGFLDTMSNNTMDINPFGSYLFGAGQFPNGFTTGSKRLDGNLAACLEFAAYSKRGGATA